MKRKKTQLLNFIVLFFSSIKVRKEAKIRKRYNQVPHLTQYTTWQGNKITINSTYKSQEVCPFPLGDHKVAMNRRESMRNTRHKNTNDPQKKYRLGTVSKNILLEGLNRFHGTNLTLSSNVDQGTYIFGLHVRPLAYQCIISQNINDFIGCSIT